MKPLIVSAHDLHGGAGRAAFRLHRALRGIGVKSEMLVQHKLSEDPYVRGHSGETGKWIGGIRVRVDRIPLYAYPNRSRLWFSPSWLPGREIIRSINSSDADVVHLHWIGAGMMRIEHLAEIEKPIVWTLHDMWPLTGGCHYDNRCGRFDAGCGECPQLGSNRKQDLSSWVFDRKQSALSALQVHLVPSSTWMAGLVERSPFMKGRPVTVLPNPVNCDLYAPQDQAQSRKSLNLPQDAKLVLFGAVDPGDPIKGFGLLREALKGMNHSADIEAVIFGGGDSDHLELPLRARFVGAIQDETRLRDLYSAADVCVVPSIQDNLPLVATEALACGTPVVGFRTSGLPDIVNHQVTGYLADPFDSMSLAAGIDWVLKQPRAEMRDAARRRALSRYESRSVARRYQAVYSQVLDQGG